MLILNRDRYFNKNNPKNIISVFPPAPIMLIQMGLNSEGQQIIFNIKFFRTSGHIVASPIRISIISTLVIGFKYGKIASELYIDDFSRVNMPLEPA